MKIAVILVILLALSGCVVLPSDAYEWTRFRLVDQVTITRTDDISPCPPMSAACATLRGDRCVIRAPQDVYLLQHEAAHCLGYGHQ